LPRLGCLIELGKFADFAGSVAWLSCNQPDDYCPQSQRRSSADGILVPPFAPGLRHVPLAVRNKTYPIPHASEGVAISGYGPWLKRHQWAKGSA